MTESRKQKSKDWRVARPRATLIGYPKVGWLWFGICAYFLSACAPTPNPTATIPTFAVDYSLIPRATFAPLPPQPTVTPGGNGTVSFTTEIQPIFNANCISCHGGIAGMWLTDYEHVMVGSINGAQVVPGNPDESPLLHYVETGLMPPNADPLSPAQIERIRRWIAEGAVKN
jgi:mono/diheme cytochrome c family protein